MVTVTNITFHPSLKNLVFPIILHLPLGDNTPEDNTPEDNTPEDNTPVCGTSIPHFYENVLLYE